MLAKSIFLSFYLIAHASSEFFRNPTQEFSSVINEELLRALTSSEEKTSNVGPSEVQPSEGKPRPLTDRRPKSIDQSSSSEANQSWMRNEEKVQLLHQYLQELSAMDSKLEDKKDWLSSAQIEGLEIWGKNAIDGLRQLRGRRIGFLVQVKLLELGDIDLPTSNLKLIKLVFPKDNHNSMMNPDVDTLPEDVVRQISKKIWKNLGGSIVLELNNLSVDSHSFFLHSSSSFNANYVVLLWWKCALKIIDLLFVMEFVEQDTVREFFRDPNIIENLLNYITLRHIYEVKSYDSIMRASPQFPQQWYWPIWHDCFKALSNEEENLLRGHFLLQSKYQRVVRLVGMKSQQDSKWRDFFVSRPFDPSEYLKQLKSSSKSLTSQTRDMIDLDVERIIELLTTSCRDLDNFISSKLLIVSRWLRDTLDLIEECISPGIIEKTLAQHPNAQSYETNRELWKLISQMDDLSWNADQYFKYVRHQRPNECSTSSVYKSTLDAYLNQLIQTLSEFKKESRRVGEQLRYQPAQLTQIQARTMEVSFDEDVKKLRKILARFRL